MKLWSKTVSAYQNYYKTKLFFQNAKNRPIYVYFLFKIFKKYEYFLLYKSLILINNI